MTGRNFKQVRSQATTVYRKPTSTKLTENVFLFSSGWLREVHCAILSTMCCAPVKFSFVPDFLGAC